MANVQALAADRRRVLSSRAFGVAFVLLILVTVFALLANPNWRNDALAYGILGVLLFYGISIAVSGSFQPFHLAIGADGLLSVSKFQFLIWNGTAVLCYLWLYAFRVVHLPTTDALSVPQNLMYAMGFSIATFAAAKGITTAYIGAGRISKPDNPGPTGVQNLVAQDDGTTPDLSKIQMLVWTLIAVVVYMVKFVHVINAQPPLTDAALQLPNIDTPLLVLMGLGQAAYLGNKLTASDVPVLTSLSQSSGKAGSAITVNGSNLWGMATVLFNGQPSPDGGAINIAQTATSFNTTVPLALSGRTLAPGDKLDISVVVDGIVSANTLPFTVA
jgi:hypothetical protein